MPFVETLDVCDHATVLASLVDERFGLPGLGNKPQPSTQETVQTTDPGRALIAGTWADIGKFKGPILRALAARAPYFDNGSAETLEDVVDFYDRRFNIGLSALEKADLLAFLRVL